MNAPPARASRSSARGCASQATRHDPGGRRTRPELPSLPRLQVLLLFLLTLGASAVPGDCVARESRKSAATAAARHAIVAAAIADPRRLPGDHDQDGWRRPAAVLDFLGVTPTMRVLDFIAGGGYYTELLARIVGERGRVIAYNTPQAREFVSAELRERRAGDRLPNVEWLIATRDDLYLSIDSVDAALFITVYHDFYLPGPGGTPPPDPLPMLALVKRALRPGGVVIVQDHVANPGGEPAVVATTLHRIDPAIVRRDFEAAGFVFDAESDALRNPDDDHTRKVFEPGIRHRTDQFLFRFRKPAR